MVQKNAADGLISNQGAGECTCNEGHHTATAINTGIIKCLVFAIVLILILIGVLIYVLVSTIQFNESSKNNILAWMWDNPIYQLLSTWTEPEALHE